MKKLRFNLIWYIPLCLWVIFYFVVPSGVSGYQNIKLSLRYFTWIYLISPSAYVFFSMILASVVLPLQLLFYIPLLFSKDTVNYKKYLYSVLIIIGIAVSAVLLQLIVWGSCPYEFDSNGYEHLRMIPFIPWPRLPFM